MHTYYLETYKISIGSEVAKERDHQVARSCCLIGDTVALRKLYLHGT
jgi:hypothetical protein